MTPKELLNRMHDIRLPIDGESAFGGWSAWPIALATLLVAALVAARILRRRAWLRQARAELRRIRVLAGQGHRGEAVRRLSLLLRSIMVFDDGGHAALVGEAWLRALDARFATDEFSRGDGRALASAPYQAHPQIAEPALLHLLSIIGAGLRRRGAR